jgi:tetratricopeptide (TPR) repeat protein
MNPGVSACAFFVVTAFLSFAQGVPSAVPASNAIPAQPAAGRQAPDEATQKITELVHAGKFTDALKLTDGLLLAYPDDQRLIKANALIERMLAAGSSRAVAPGNSQPAEPVTAMNAEQLSGMDKVDYNALIQLAREAQDSKDTVEQFTLMGRFMGQSIGFLQKHPNQMLIWRLRAAIAIAASQPLEGYEAGRKLLAAGSADSNDPAVQQLLAQLKNKGWLDQDGAASLQLVEDKTHFADDQICEDAYKTGAKIETDKAIVRMTSVIKQNSKSWPCFYYRSALYSKNEDHRDQAILDAGNAVELAPAKETRPLLQRASLYDLTAHWDQALADCEAVHSKSHSYAGCYEIREIALFRLNRFQEALAASIEALKPESGLDQHRRANSYFIRGSSQFTLRQYSEAMDSLSQSLTLGLADEWALTAHFQEGAAAWKLGQLEKAKADAAFDLQSDPRLRIRFGGDHLLEVFDLDKRRESTMTAVEAAETAQTKGDWPAAFEAWNEAWSYCTSYMQDGAETVAKVRDGLFTNYPKLTVSPALPEVARQYMAQAEAFAQEKNMSKSVDAYNKVNRIAPWFPQAYLDRGFLMGEKEHMYKRGIADLQMYLKLAPGAENALKVQGKISEWQTMLK